MNGIYEKNRFLFAQIFTENLRIRWCHFSSIEYNTFTTCGKIWNATWTNHSFAWSFNEISSDLFLNWFSVSFFALRSLCEINFVHHKFKVLLEIPQYTEVKLVILVFFHFKNDATLKFYGFYFIKWTFAMEHSSLWRSFRFDTMAIFRTRCIPLNWAHTADRLYTVELVIIHVFSLNATTVIYKKQRHIETIKSNENGTFKFHFNLFILVRFSK